jgi:signal transduction histidine kinase
VASRANNIKIGLLTGAILIAVATLIYTQSLVVKLQENQRHTADLYARSIEYIANARTTEGDYSFVFDQVIRAIDFPMILTDGKNHPLQPLKTNIRNVAVDTTLSFEKQIAYVHTILEKMDAENPPIKVMYQDSTILQYVHFGESPLIVQLRWLPVIELIIAALFIFLGYVGFNYIRRSEQSNIWVGMAKETAHQLGTPLSSILGWVEILRLAGEGNPKITDTVDEMHNDLERLNKVAARFSKIGSKPDLKPENVRNALTNVLGYLERRIPHMGKNVSLTLNAPENLSVPMNRELFEWVIENLVKNALDAMDGVGSVLVTVLERNDEVIIDVIDTGKGIDLQLRKEIFRPGYSTKPRGWGLGLSLSKRIIEIYHKGKLFVKESKPGKGTTFRIKLPK